MSKTRSLYMCFHAKVHDDFIYCDKGIKFVGAEANGCDGKLSIKRLWRGKPLIVKQCQDCPHFDYMGAAIPKKERGWSSLLLT